MVEFSMDDWWYVNISIYFDGGRLSTRAQYCHIKDDMLSLYKFDTGKLDFVLDLDSIQEIRISYWDKENLTFLGRPTLQDVVLWQRDKKMGLNADGSENV